MRNRAMRRLGFTLTEMLVAAALGTVVGTIMIKAYQGMAKAQGVAQGSADIRDMGTNSTESLYRELKHVKRLFNRPFPSNIRTSTWLARIPVQGVYGGGPDPVVEPGPDLAASEFILPAINPDANLAQSDPGNPLLTDLYPDQVGNALFFLTLEDPVVAKPLAAEPGPTGTFNGEVYGDALEVSLAAYRAHLYFIARKPLGNGPVIRPGSSFTYTLMHWQSAPYLDADDVDALADDVLNAWPGAGKPPKAPKGPKKKGKGPGRSTTEALLARNYMNNLVAFLASSRQVAGMMDPQVEDASLGLPPLGPNALYESTFGIRVNASKEWLTLKGNVTTGFQTGDFRTALKGMARSSHGAIDLAFNTDAGGAFPAVPAGTLRVPALGSPADGTPYGFECAIVGPPSSRQVLFRINLSGRALGARGNFAQTFQQVVAIAEE